MKRTPKHKTFLTHLLLSLCKKKWLVVGHRVVGDQGEGMGLLTDPNMIARKCLPEGSILSEWVAEEEL
jgi:hypothetical protein